MASASEVFDSPMALISRCYLGRNLGGASGLIGPSGKLLRKCWLAFQPLRGEGFPLRWLANRMVLEASRLNISG